MRSPTVCCLLLLAVAVGGSVPLASAAGAAPPGNYEALTVSEWKLLEDSWREAARQLAPLSPVPPLPPCPPLPLLQPPHSLARCLRLQPTTAACQPRRASAHPG